MDIAERNISTGFDLAMSLAWAKNAAEVMEAQIFWIAFRHPTLIKVVKCVGPTLRSSRRWGKIAD